MRGRTAWVSAGFDARPGLLPGLTDAPRGADSPSSQQRGCGEPGAGHRPQAAVATVGEAACSLVCKGSAVLTYSGREPRH